MDCGFGGGCFQGVGNDSLVEGVMRLEFPPLPREPLPLLLPRLLPRLLRLREPLLALLLLSP